MSSFFQLISLNLKWITRINPSGFLKNASFNVSCLIVPKIVILDKDIGGSLISLHLVSIEFFILLRELNMVQFFVVILKEFLI